MIITVFYRTREDGVRLNRTLDAVVDENGEPVFEDKEVTDENGNTVIVREPIPTGFKIRKVGTDEIYDDAIDVEDAPYVYETTNVPIEKEVLLDEQSELAES